MSFMTLALCRQVMLDILEQFAIYTLQGDPRHLTIIRDVGHLVPTPIHDPPTDDQRGDGTRCTLQLWLNIRREIGAAVSKRFQVQ